MQRSQADALEVELIRSLFESVIPSAIMSAGFVIGGALIVRQTGDALLLTLLAVGAVASIARLAVAVMAGRTAARPTLSLTEARLLQSRFTMVYFGFAIVLGVFGSQAMRLPHPTVHMLVICLLVGYAAGVAASVGLRPRIAIPCMLVAIVPPAIVALVWLDPLYWAMSVQTIAFLIGGVKAVQLRHRRAVRNIGRRLTFATLARKDTLTALPNRLALREWYDEHVTFAEPGPVAVHYLDLDGFKPVNDSYGHPVGDAVLVAVGKRIANVVRSADIVARLGGDEFVVVQRSLAGPEEAALLAGRIATVIARPFQIGEQRIAISTCIGYVVSDEPSDDLDDLLSLADQALYAGKRGAGAVVSYDAVQAQTVRVAA